MRFSLRQHRTSRARHQRGSFRGLLRRSPVGVAAGYAFLRLLAGHKNLSRWHRPFVMRCCLTAPAESDILCIGRYIYEQLADRETALRVMIAIRDAIGKLEMMPSRFPLVGRRRLARKGYHKMVVRGYVIAYLIDEGNRAVQVVRVFGKGQNWMREL